MENNLQDTCPFTCKHEQVEVRRRRQVNGIEVAVRQCLTCGAHCGSVPKRDTHFELLTTWDDELSREWQEKRSAWYKERADENDRAFWEFHRQHMLSDKWKRLRQLVFKRCDWVCEGCASAEAVHVHHLTYERLGDEMLFDLVGLCLSCHEKIHGRPLEDRKS